MKEFCIEINESQPLEKVEAKLKEMGYVEEIVPASHASAIVAWKDGQYNIFWGGINYLTGELSIPLKTLDEL